MLVNLHYMCYIKLLHMGFNDIWAVIDKVQPFGQLLTKYNIGKPCTVLGLLDLLNEAEYLNEQNEMLCRVLS